MGVLVTLFADPLRRETYLLPPCHSEFAETLRRFRVKKDFSYFNINLKIMRE